jgi:hypothetical protein
MGKVYERTFAWLDGTGSGSETIAHLRENGRIPVMCCAFEGPPNIVRFHGTGRVVTREYRRRKNLSSIDGLPAFDVDPVDEPQRVP